MVSVGVVYYIVANEKMDVIVRCLSKCHNQLSYSSFAKLFTFFTNPLWNQTFELK